MGLSIRCRATCLRGSALLAIAFMTAAPWFAHADTPAQQQELAAALRQVDALDRLIEQSSATSSAIPGERYYFDYSRLRADLARIRGGLRDYLSPARAQPRDVAELSTSYRAESEANVQARSPRP